jgi:hypothetical protein
MRRLEPEEQRETRAALVTSRQSAREIRPAHAPGRVRERPLLLGARRCFSVGVAEREDSRLHRRPAALAEVVELGERATLAGLGEVIPGLERRIPSQAEAALAARKEPAATVVAAFPTMRRAAEEERAVTGLAPDARMAARQRQAMSEAMAERTGPERVM